MSKAIVGTLLLLLGFSATGAAVAHEEHKCKKGYVMTDDHRCEKPRP